MPLFLATLALALGSSDAAEPPPNMVLVLADDCTKVDLGCYGGQAKTPHLTALATEGMQFANCYQAAPMCSPTRHCLYTGRYPVASGAYPNHTRVYDGIGSIAVDLQAGGYRTALSGKRHIAPKSEFPFEFSGKNNPDLPAIETFLDECREATTPFLLVACSNEPHSPWDKGDPAAYPPESLVLPPKWVDTPETREAYSRYLAEITYFDSQVGQLLAALEERDLGENTLVVVLSEQGSGFPFAKWTCSHAGLGSGMIARWPGHVAAGSQSQALVEYVDIVPTLLEAAHLEPTRPLDGASFLPVLRGETDVHKRYVFGEQTSRGINNGPPHYGIRSVQRGSLRLIHNLTPEVAFQNAANQTAFFRSWERAAAAGDDHAAAAIAFHAHRPEWELYDLASDPHEQHNLIDEPMQAAAVEELRRELTAWMQRQGDKGQATERAAYDRMPNRAAPKKRAATRRNMARRCSVLSVGRLDEE